MSSSFKDITAEYIRSQYARSIPKACPWGFCVLDYDPVERRIIGGGGPLACPCDHLPGWNAKNIDGMAKPQWKVKARGRHGSRIERSKRRHADVVDFEGYQTWKGYAELAAKYSELINE